jgi:hypothetical protein
MILFHSHETCPACMIGKSHLENKPKIIELATKPLGRVTTDLFSSSVVPIEVYSYVLVITEGHTVFRWLYGLKSRRISSKSFRDGTSTLLNSNNCKNWL